MQIYSIRLYMQKNPIGIYFPNRKSPISWINHKFQPEQILVYHRKFIMLCSRLFWLVTIYCPRSLVKGTGHIYSRATLVLARSHVPTHVYLPPWSTSRQNFS